jgi:MscS family membrane protein
MAQWIDWLTTVTGLKTWMLVVFLVVLGALLIDFVQRRLSRRLGKAVAATPNRWDDAAFYAAARPLTLIIWVVGITVAAQFIPLGDDDRLLTAPVINRVRQVGLLVALVWFLLRLVVGIEKNYIESAEDHGEEIDETTVHAIARLTRIAIIVTGALVVMDTLGFSVSGLLAAGGIGGIAIGLAAKDLLANFFGGLTIFMDRPFSVGDWIRSPDRSIEGVVEKIGWRQTTIVKFDRRPMYVPNSTFTTITVENPSRMTHRRINETIGIRYADVGAMEAIVDAVRAMLRDHPEIDEGQTLMVHFDAFGPSSIDFFIYCFTHTVNWQKFHEVKQDVLLKISRIIADHGAEVAFPTTSVHIESTPEFAGLGGPGGPDPDAPEPGGSAGDQPPR